MFEDMQRMFRESLAAFRAELNKREPEDEVADLLSSMRRELVEARAMLPELSRTLEDARAELQRERGQLEQCARRGRLAEEIGDQETVRIAEQFAERHRERIRVLEQKISATEAELALRSQEAEEMKRRYQEADANRAALVAQLRRAQAQQRIRSVADEASDSFAEWARMEEKVGDSAAYADALEELDPTPPPPDDREAVEERLRELKRRMGRDS